MYGKIWQRFVPVSRHSRSSAQLFINLRNSIISISMSADSVARESILYRKRYNYGVTVDTQFSNIIAVAIWELTFLFLGAELLNWKRNFADVTSIYLKFYFRSIIIYPQRTHPFFFISSGEIDQATLNSLTNLTSSCKKINIFFLLLNAHFSHYDGCWANVCTLCANWKVHMYYFPL